MLTCKICLLQFKKPRFNSPRLCVCGRCTNALNEYKEVAEHSYSQVGDMLKTGMLRNTHADTSPDTPVWRQKRAQKTLENFDREYQAALPGWINRLVSNKNNRRKTFKIIRAHRRGLLHLDRPHGWGYPSNWKSVALRIRALDHYTCVNCGTQDSELHVHHIVYVSNFGTHQQQNLVTLCRACHEVEHKRVFDFGENLSNSDTPPDQDERRQTVDVLPNENAQPSSSDKKNPKEIDTWGTATFELTIKALVDEAGENIFILEAVINNKLFQKYWTASKVSGFIAMREWLGKHKIPYRAWVKKY